MTEIVIQHCKIRIVRRGGWSWGADPQRLLQSAVRALPALIAARLAEMWPGEAEREITAPIRVTVPVRIAELLAVASVSDQGSFSLQNPLAAAIDARLTSILKTVIERECRAGSSMNSTTLSPDEDETEDNGISHEILWNSTIIRMLLSWREEGVLESRLESCSLSSLETWHQNLAQLTAQPRTGRAAVQVDMTVRSIREKAAGLPCPLSDRVTALRYRLIIMLELAAESGVMPGDPAVRRELDRLFPLKAGGTGEQSAFVDSGHRHPHEPIDAPEEIALDLKPQAAAARRDSPARRVKPRLSSRTGIHVCSALPFLLLGPLSRMGYLRALAGRLEAAGCSSQSPLFATALAYKVLAPSERGWRRHPTVAAAAAAFAGLVETAPDPELAEFARQLSARLSPLDQLLSSTVTGGHNRSQPLLLERAVLRQRAGLLLVDAEGLFPVAWADGIDGLAESIAACRGSVILVPQSVAQTQLLGRLEAEEVHFITDAPPTRHERWRMLRRLPADRWWTNDRTSPEATLLKAARQLADRSEEARDLWQMLAVERPGVPPNSEAAFDCHLTLAASTALGIIAWNLWREREPTSPQLALERFGDLDAYIHHSSESIRVRLPLGRRFQDLHERGLLADVRDVPWLEGRALLFSGG
jgi:hypothetical protein